MVKTPVMSVYFKNTLEIILRPESSQIGIVKKNRRCVGFEALRVSTTNQFRSILWVGFLFLMCTGMIMFTTGRVNAESVSKTNPDKATVVLDPGHGGIDPGVQGAQNTTEKQIAMAFAVALTERLKKDYQVILTRKDDYQIDIFERPAIANHNKADLFISLHAGGSLRSSPRGICLFYYDKPNKNIPLETQIPNSTDSGNPIRTWEQNRPDLLNQSRRIVELIHTQLSRADENLSVIRRGAPLIALVGLNMPSCLIEIGTITNPMDAKMLTNDEYLTKLANSVCDAIDDFFSTKEN